MLIVTPLPRKHAALDAASAFVSAHMVYCATLKKICCVFATFPHNHMGGVDLAVVHIRICLPNRVIKHVDDATTPGALPQIMRLHWARA